MENKENFCFTYSAKDREEVRAIRQKYAEPERIEDKMTQLRKLDASVTQKASVVSLILGVIGSLIMGSGMSLVMTDLGSALKLGGTLALLLGLVLGVVGIVLVSLAYPIYNKLVKKEKERVAPEIIRLADELMK